MSGAVAGALAARGVGHGDVVSFQLPNWWEFTVLHLACLKLGAVSNPLMVIFRERELTFMLGLARSKVLVVPASFRGFDYPAMVAGNPLGPARPRACLRGGRHGRDAFDQLLAARRSRLRPCPPTM